MSKKSTFSVIIPVRKISDYLIKETIPKILEQSYQDFEIIILPDKESSQKSSARVSQRRPVSDMGRPVSGWPKTRIIPSFPKTGPAQKRDLAAQKSKGQILAFLDDDAYPSQNWLKNAAGYFRKKNEVAAVCGPGITPPHDNLRQKASGWVWSTWLGAGGAGVYRSLPQKKREVDDYPTFNLLIRKDDFLKVGGFDSHFWPGEDTKLCLDLIQKLGKKIIYDPKILVHHHRRPLFLSHLKQVGSYGLHRGHFARILPKTSARIGYLMPVFFTLGLIGGFFLSLFNQFFLAIYLSTIAFYLLLLMKEVAVVYSKEKNIKLAILVAIGIFLTHLWYGLRFIQGYFSKSLKQ